MKRLRGWPRSLFGRIALILFIGLGAAHGLSFWLLVAERGMAMRSLVLGNLATDAVNVVALMERLPPAERAAWLPRLDRRNYRFGLEAPQAMQGVPAAGAVTAPSATSTSSLPSSSAPPSVSPGLPASTALATQPPPSAEALAIARAVGDALVPARRVQAVPPPDAGVVLRLQVPLADGTGMSVDVAAPRWSISTWAVAALALQLALLAALCLWAVRQATRPLQALAEAADALGPAQAQPPMPLDGPREVARAASAFNRMQSRIHAHLDERMRILAAVSHDLQTPITRLRLRADLLDDTVLRDKLQADLAEMQALVEEGISYARSAQAVREPACLVDLRALLASIVGDYADAGRPVLLQAGEPMRCHTRPQALRRLVCNLVDNALKFAGAAEVAIDRAPGGALQLQVLDRGPGIPESQLQAVLQPYVRLEDSRSRSTGGTGLGLAIADQLAQALGGTLVLAARPGGGLAARVKLAAAEPQP